METRIEIIKTKHTERTKGVSEQGCATCELVHQCTGE